MASVPTSSPQPLPTDLAALPHLLAYSQSLQRWRAEHAIEEDLNGHDLDHLVSYRLHPNRVAIGFRLLARHLASGLQINEAQGRPEIIREPRAFRAEHVDGLGSFIQQGQLLWLHSLRSSNHQCHRLPWTNLVVQIAT